MSGRAFKPSIAFLRKVRDCKVYAFFGYTMRRGGYHGVKGGEAAIRAHAAAGYINKPGSADLGRPSYATLTDEGEKLLAKAAERRP